MDQTKLDAFQESTGLSLVELKEYIQLTNVDQKKFICAYWLRGTCLFPKELCHHAHGLEDLDYVIESNTTILPLYPSAISERQMFFDKLERKYYVLHASQKSEFVQKEVNKFATSLGLDHEEGKVYSLKELQDNRKIRGTLLTYTLLEDLIKFIRHIFKSLGETNPVPKQLLVNELQRVGYCQIVRGSKTYKPGTVLYHLQSYGVCFPVDIEDKSFKLERLVANIQVPTLSENPKTESQQVDFTNKNDIDDQDDDEDGDEVEENECEEEPEKVHNQGDRWTFFIPINNLELITQNFTSLFHEVLEELIKQDSVFNYEALMFAVDSRVNQSNQNNYPNVSAMVPHLEPILMLHNISFDQFYTSVIRPHYPSIAQICTDFDHSGLYRFQIERYFNQKQRDCLEEYLARPKYKFYLCKYWLRGLCAFKRQDCRFAHGLSELEYQSVDTNLNHKEMEDLQTPLRVDKKSLIVVKTYRVLYFYQFEMLKQGRIQKDQLKTIFEISQVKQYRDQLRKLIRYELVINLYHLISNNMPQKKSYIAKYFKYCGFYQTELSEFKVIKILLCFNICFERDIEEEQFVEDSQKEEEMLQLQQEAKKQLEDENFQTKKMKDKCTKRQKYKESKCSKKPKDDQQEQIVQGPKVMGKKKIRALKKVAYMIPYRPIEQVQDYYISLVIQILIDELTENLSKHIEEPNTSSSDQVKKSSSFTFLPLSEQTIKKSINQKDTRIDMPGLYNYLRMNGKRTNITDFIRVEILSILGDRLESHVKEQVDPKWSEILQIFRQNSQDFLILDDDMDGIEQFIFECLKQLNQRQKYIINVDKFQVIVEQQFKSQQSQLQTNDKLKVFLRDNIVYGDQIKVEFTNYFLQTYNQGLFIIINPKQTIPGSLGQKQKTCKCGQRFLFPTDQTKLRLHNDEQLDALKEQIIEMGLIDPIVRDTLIVDNNVKLDIAREIFNHVNFVGVDFEGQLKQGVLWLAQLGIQIKGTKRLIIILDLMNAQVNQKDDVFHAQLLSLLSSVMQDLSIRKVFHDCRRDSHALHQNGICTKNATDTSVTYSLFQQITYFDQWKQQQESTTQTKKVKTKEKGLSGVLKEIHQFNQPSLNDVLLNWNAKHSQNELKGQFHNHFQNASHDYFFKRPHPEFMSYSARDVEDLTEVQTRMELSLKSLLTDPFIIEKLTTRNLQYYL